MTRGFRVLLALSLLVNVFAIGALAGGAVMLQRPGIMHLPGRQATARGRPIVVAGAGLPQADRVRFRQAMLAVLRENRNLLRTERESRQAAAQLFMQPQFDEAAVAADLKQAADAESQLRDRLQATAIEFAAGLPVDERAILAQGLKQGGMLPRQPAPQAAQQ